MMLALGADERDAPAERRLTLSPDAEVWGKTASPTCRARRRRRPSATHWWPGTLGRCASTPCSALPRSTRSGRRSNTARSADVERSICRPALATLMQRGNRGRMLRTRPAPSKTPSGPRVPPRSTRSPPCTRRQALQTQRRAGSGAASERRALRKAPDTGTSGSRSGRPWGSPPASRRPCRRPWTTPCTPSPLAGPPRRLHGVVARPTGTRWRENADAPGEPPPRHCCRAALSPPRPAVAGSHSRREYRADAGAGEV